MKLIRKVEYYTISDVRTLPGSTIIGFFVHLKVAPCHNSGNGFDVRVSSGEAQNCWCILLLDRALYVRIYIELYKLNYKKIVTALIFDFMICLWMTLRLFTLYQPIFNVNSHLQIIGIYRYTQYNIIMFIAFEGNTRVTQFK